MLRRIRIGFALLAVLLLAPLGFLIGRTLDTLDRERELQHAAVANRVFDEAEGALAEFLREEQSRPTDAYRLWPSGVAWMESRPPFVRAYFQIDHQGGIRTSASEPELDATIRAALAPAQIADLERVESELGRANAVGERLASLEESPRSLRIAVEPAKGQAASRSDAIPSEASFAEVREQKKKQDGGKAPAPGTARNVQSIDLITGRAKAGKAETSQAETDDEGSYSSNRALETLGRIAKITARKDVKPSPTLDARAPMAAAAAEAPERDRFEDRDLATDNRMRQASPKAGALEVEHAGGEDEGVEVAEQVAAAAPRAPTRAVLHKGPLVLAPSRFSGERIDDGRLLLYRTALDEVGRAVRQGMLVSVDELGIWLTRRVLGESELRESLDIELRAASVPVTAPLPTNRYVYAYRFAEPFEMLSMQLAISPLDDGGNARNIGWLSALLIAASTVGLYAVYRMAAVAIHFAERRSNFAAAVSHELKTPLTAIRMYSEMLRDGMVPDEAKRNDYYQTITSESERLTRLIDNVLEWSKLEKHQREATLITADPSGTIREVVQLIGPHAEAQGFEIDVRLAAALPPVRHDPDALQQILYNLIDNAIKYARGHEPMRIEVEAAPAEGGVAVRVRDHGPGVSPDKLPLVFEAFYRGEDELTRETKGTGIGLALSRALAESMNGRLDSRNHADGGLEVELWIPAGA